ncbi:hypothetical protein OOK41_13640 [Micromonospora sp. NBC_01655]|uniref:hypothetical protein n=1 Tax=Micromonospora sp. NBC_01655 TaxID=2975983 RepID=UPI002253F397|nr:hypothetical protein [Micromonospora sp. NBC_01655]MCX4471337.1 hypothetical protein [Micromonospora sp. NBC_01655]
MLCLPRRRVLAAVGPAGGPYRDLLLAEAGGWRRLSRLPDDVVALLRLPDGACAAVTAQGGTWIHADDGSSHRGAALDLPDDAVPVWGATGSPDGRLVATWSHTTATLVDRRTGELVAAAAPLEPLPGGDATVTIRPSPALPDLRYDLAAGRIAHLDFLQDGDGLLAGTIDGAVRLLGPDFGARGTLTSHQRFPVVLAAPAGRIVVSAKDGVTRVHPWPTAGVDGTAVELRPAPGDPRGRIAMSPRGLAARRRAGRRGQSGGRPHRRRHGVPVGPDADGAGPAGAQAARRGGRRRRGRRARGPRRRPALRRRRADPPRTAR